MKKETSSYLLLDPLQKKRRKSPRHIRPQALCERKEEKSASYLPPDPLEKRQEEEKIHVISAPRPIEKRKEVEKLHVISAPRPLGKKKRRRQKSTSYLPPDTSQLRNFSPTAVQLCFNDHNYSTPQQTLNHRIIKATL